MIFVGCSSSWPTKEKETFIEECVELNSSELFSSDQSPEDLCKCTMKEFSEQITWPDYNKILNGNLNKDEKAFFNNKVQVVLDKIVEKCKPAVLIN
tara:strand:- start:1959 stop:2246 length:288 start_codon:yes stop_codon:yes gene_type:complete